ncbi:Protein kinase domain-containing protein [Durusdinium trenchii]|uniref:Protein kinase domain-containing protein n=1 Tax=Durusdinium trenchii TaxID=1381693 RepID=A0ABP0J4Q1_9DINO
MDSYRVGDPALVNPRRDIMIGSHTGLIKTASGWVKAELVEAGEAVDFTAGRRALAQPELGELTDKFTDKKLLLHPGEIQHEHIKALGVQMDGKLLKSTLTPDRFHRVRQGVRGLLRRGRCTGKVLEIVIGHCTYCGLMNRCLLSTFHASYKFIRNSYYEAAPLWNSVKAELRAFSGLMALLVADWSRPWNSVVTVSDASEEGFGVCAAAWEPQVAAEVGRVSERDRFRRAGGHSARESALTSAGFVKDEASGKWADGLLEDEEYLRLSGWDLKQDFPEVPVHQLKSQEWATVRQGAWRRSEHIVHLEARALVKSFELAVLEPGVVTRSQKRRCPVLEQGSELGDMKRKRQKTLQTPNLRAQLLTSPNFVPPTLESLSKLEIASGRPARFVREESDSSSSSSMEKKDTRAKVLQKRSRRRLKKYVDEVMQAQSSGLSLLERKAIGERTALYYAQEYRQFLVFSKKRRLQTVAATEMDAALTEYFNAWPKRLDVWDMQLVSGNLAMVLLMTSPCLKCSDALDRTSNKD